MMGVRTRPIWKTSTCLMQPSAALPCPALRCPDHVASLDEVGLKVGGQRLEPDRVVVVVAWRGVVSSRTGGAAAAGGRARLASPWCVGWRTSRCARRYDMTGSG